VDTGSVGIRDQAAWHWVRPGVVALAFAVAFVGSGALVAQIDTRPVDWTSAAKLEHLQEHPDRYDTIYVGSSRAMRGFQPELFDRTMAAQGIATRTFNAGIPASDAFETRRFIQQILELEGHSLRLLIVAPAEFRVDLSRQQAQSNRMVAWHDWMGTTGALRAIWETDGRPWEKGTWLFNHLEAFFINLTNTGRIVTHLLLEPNLSSTLDLAFGMAGDGYVSLDYLAENYPTDALATRQRGVANIATYERVLGNLADVRSNPPPEPADYEVAYVDDLADLIRSHGVEVLFVKEPTLSIQRQYLRWLSDNDSTLPIIDFGDPAEFPELFEQGVFFDFNHLNEEGAGRYTAQVADAVAALIYGVP